MGALGEHGAWIRTREGKADLLCRNIDQVELVIREGTQGVSRHDYDQQPPFGFRSVAYFGEVHFAIPLHDPRGELARLKQAVAQYPEALKQRIVKDSLWGADEKLPWQAEACPTVQVLTWHVGHALACLPRGSHRSSSALA